MLLVDLRNIPPKHTSETYLATYPETYLRNALPPALFAERPLYIWPSQLCPSGYSRQAAALQELERWDEAVAICERCIAKCAKDDADSLRKTLAEACQLCHGAFDGDDFDSFGALVNAPVYPGSNC